MGETACTFVTKGERCERLLNRFSCYSVGRGLVTTHIVAESCMHEYCAAMIMMVRMEAPSQTLSVMSDKLQNVSRQTLEGLKQTTFLYINYYFYTFIFSVVSAAER